MCTTPSSPTSLCTRTEAHTDWRNLTACLAPGRDNEALRDCFARCFSTLRKQKECLPDRCTLGLRSFSCLSGAATSGAGYRLEVTRGIQAPHMVFNRQ